MANHSFEPFASSPSSVECMNPQAENAGYLGNSTAADRPSTIWLDWRTSAGQTSVPFRYPSRNLPRYSWPTKPGRRIDSMEAEVNIMSPRSVNEEQEQTRRADTHGKRKRSKYAARACQYCQRRKIRASGPLCMLLPPF